MAISISQVSFEHHVTALGIAEAEPRISWRFAGNASDWEQSAFDIEIARGHDGPSNIHSANSSQSILVSWPEEPLASAEYAKVRARAYGQEGQPSTPWSDWVAVETGLLESDDWSGAVAIAADRDSEIGQPKRPIHFRKEFSVNSAVRSARLYITSLGLYEAEINGQRVGENVLAPGFQSYNFRHVYDTYDVTDLIKDGENAIGVLVGEGWYVGRFGFQGNRELFGNTLGVLSLLTVTYEDGETVTIPSDSSWQSNTGPILQSNIYDGETYDSRLEADIEGWSEASFGGADWLGVKEIAGPKGTLMPLDGPPIRITEEVKLKEVFTSPSGKTLLDFGQNLVGWLRLTVEGPSGTNITLKHAEVLEDGELGLEPLRSAKVTENIILHGNGVQTYAPRFTFHGFRYVQVDGWPEETPLDENAVTAIVVHSDMEQTGWFESSHELLNQFHRNVRWSMRGNFLSLPTDCPQRDERLGWTGDAHAFCNTSNFLYNTAGFWKGWHRDVWSEMQRFDSMVVPFFVPILPPGDRAQPAAVWGDVAVANPWNLYHAFGDKAMLKDQFAQSQAWIDVGIPRDQASQLWARNSFQFADWLDPKAPADDAGAATTAKILVADAYLVRMTSILSQMAKALGDDANADKYSQQRDALAAEFRKAWLVDGAMANRTQTAYALGIDFELFEGEDQLATAAETLRDIIAENDYLVGTGFAGTPALGPALQRIGAVEDMYSMLLQTKVPSWLYQVVKNGTTTWERWDSMLDDGSLNVGSMTSFNHYAFGAVADWIHGTIGGIKAAEPGWQKIKVAPVPGGGITNADTKYISGYGEVRAQWKIEDGEFSLNVWVPPNTRAEVTLPKGGETTEVGSGYHEFRESGH